MEDNRVECPNQWGVIHWPSVWPSVCGQEHELGTTQTNPASGKGGTWTWGPPITSPVLLLLGHMYCLLTKEVSEFTKLSIRWTRDERAVPSLMTRVRKEQGSSCDILPD